MKLWWLADDGRLATEVAAVRAATSEGWFHSTEWGLRSMRVAVEGIITAHGFDYPVRLIYPDQFPSVPAWVEPQDPEALWSGHQYGRGGPLCLELRPDNWHPSASGGDVLRSAYNLLRTENPLGAGSSARVPSAEQIGGIQTYDWGQSPVLIRQGCLQRIVDGTATDMRAVRWWRAADSILPAFVYDADDAAGSGGPPKADVLTGQIELAVCIAQTAAPAQVPTSRSELAAALGLELDSERFPGALIAFAVDGSDVVPYYSANQTSVEPQKLVPIPDDMGARSGGMSPATTPSVALVGVGSVGSKIAESIVRAGVSSLVLVDGDVMLPGNLERHTLDWRDVGFRKANAVKRRLLNIRPEAEVLVVAENLNWQRSSRRQATVTDAVASCDIIVDATGDVPSSLLLGAIAADNGKAFVSVEVLEGGIGCIIARSLPERDASYVEGRAGLLAYCEHRAIAPPQSGVRAYEAFDDGGAPIVADDAAVSVAAAHAARIALDVLNGAWDAEAPAWLLIGLSRAWLFDGHGHTIGLHLPRPTTRPEPELSLAPEDVDTAHRLVLTLLEEARSETAASE